MLSRCYCDTFKSRHPTYTGCSVSEDWITFSNFKRWMETQDWKGKHLDKDILSPNNKVYGEQTCIFVTANVNTLLIDCAATRGKLMLGVYWNKQRGKFMAQCKDGNSKSIYLGYYNTELEAHQAWKAYKHSLACKLAEEQTDPRVADALRIRYKQLCLKINTQQRLNYNLSATIVAEDKNYLIKKLYKICLDVL